MWTSRLAVVVGVLAPGLAIAQPGPEDAQQNAAPVAAAAAAAPVQPLPAYSGPPGEYVAPAPSAQPMLQPGQPQITAQAPGIKDPQTAGLLSGVVTAGGIGLMLVAAHMDNNNSDGSSNSGQGAVATVGALAFVIGPTTGHIYAGHTWNTGLGIRVASTVGMLIGVASLVNSCCDDSNSSGGGAAALLIGSMIGYGVGTVYEIATAPQAARDYNRTHGLDLQLSVVPIRDTRNATSPGVGFVGRF